MKPARPFRRFSWAQPSRAVAVGYSAACLLTACIVADKPNVHCASCTPAPLCPPALQCSSTQVAVATAAPAVPTGLSNGKREFTLKDTVVRPLHSELTGKDYELLIGLPPSFEKEMDRTYPVLLVLDGQWDFPLVNTLAGGLRFDQVMPEMLIVGIAYGGENPDYDELRADDYLPTKARSLSGVEQGGGAPRFLSWLESTVIPLLEREYRGDPQHRILAGTSYGGLFTLYALFEKPEVFETYVAICPSVPWDGRYMFRREQEFHKAHARLERRLWLSSGGAEWPDYLQSELAFFRQVQNSRYAGLVLRTYQAAGERHGGLKPESFNRALRFASEPFIAPTVKNNSNRAAPARNGKH